MRQTGGLRKSFVLAHSPRAGRKICPGAEQSRARGVPLRRWSSLARESMILDLPTVSSVERGDGGGLDVASAAARLSAAKSAEHRANSCRFCGGALHDFV